MTTNSLWNKMKDKLAKDIEFYQSQVVTPNANVDHPEVRLSECKSQLQFMINTECANDVRITKIKEDYKNSDIVMSELLRNSYHSELTTDEIKYLLLWSGDYDDITNVDEYVSSIAAPEIIVIDSDYNKASDLTTCLDFIMHGNYKLHKIRAYTNAVLYFIDNVITTGNARNCILIMDLDFFTHEGGDLKRGIGYKMLTELERHDANIRTIITSSYEPEKSMIDYPFVVGNIVLDESSNFRAYPESKLRELINKALEDRKNE